MIERNEMNTIVMFDRRQSNYVFTSLCEIELVKISKDI